MRVNTDIIYEGTSTNGSTTDSFQLEHIYGYSIFIEYTGDSPEMETEVKLQISNDEESWIDYHTFNLTGTSGPTLVNCSDAFYKFARLSIDGKRGALTAAITVYKKGV